MESYFATIPVPDSTRFRSRYKVGAHEECRALLNAVRRNALGPDGQAPTVAQIAEMLGMHESTLFTYCTQPRRDRSAKQRGTPYLVLYALGAMAACPQGVARTLFGPGVR